MPAAQQLGVGTVTGQQIHGARRNFVDGWRLAYRRRDERRRRRARGIGVRKQLALSRRSIVGRSCFVGNSPNND
jgi:hypothetical protein